MRSTSLFCIVVTGTIVVACSGASPSPLFGAPAGPPSTSDASTDTGDDAGDAATPVDGSGGPTNGGSNGPKDAAAEAAPADAGDKAFVCDDGRASGSPVSCTRPKLCCAGRAQGGAPYTCEQAGNCQGVPVACRAASDCTGGKVCCGTYVNQAWQKVECASSCAGSDRLVMCDPSAAIPAGCSALNPFCAESTRLPGFGYCRSTP